MAAMLVLLGAPVARAAQGESRPPGSPPQGVLFLSVDAFRADRISATGYQRPTTPVLDRWADEAVRFEQAISQSAWTSPGLVSLFTSLYPSVHGMDAQGKRFDGVTATPLHHLRKAGFRVLGYAATGDNFADLGFEPERELRSVDRLFAALREVKDGRFFLWFHSRITHLPYNVLPQYEALFPPPARHLTPNKLQRLLWQTVIRKGTVSFDAEDRPEIEALYDAKVREQDDALGAVLTELNALGLSERTLVVIVADHGEELLDHGFVGHASTSLAATLYDEILRIPLIIRVPGSGPRGIVRDQVQQIDIMPTLFDLLGLNTRGAMQGRSLVPLMRGTPDPHPVPAFSETNPCGWQCPEERKRHRLKAVRTPEWKLIRGNANGDDQRELYHLPTDPAERRNLAAARPDVVQGLESLLERQERTNLRAAAQMATAAGQVLVKRARRRFNAGDLEEAAQALERVEHLRRVYETENPPFTREPELRRRWFDVVGRAYALLGRLYLRRGDLLRGRTR
jgi:arylsulfatase A-like enzyme